MRKKFKGHKLEQPMVLKEYDYYIHLSRKFPKMSLEELKQYVIDKKNVINSKDKYYVKKIRIKKKTEVQPTYCNKTEDGKFIIQF